jgi:transposase-like protein
MLATAIDSEVSEYLAEHAHQLDKDGKRLVVRNGYLPPREIQTGLGQVAVRQPRVNDKRQDEEGNRMRFSSKILPAYLRRTKSIDELIPWLYLRGISTGDFSDALQAILGPQAKGLSATNVVRLKECWQQEWKTWSQQSLEGKEYVYLWADGIHFNIRLEGPGNNKQCILVLIRILIKSHAISILWHILMRTVVALLDSKPPCRPQKDVHSLCTLCC